MFTVFVGDDFDGASPRATILALDGEGGDEGRSCFESIAGGYYN